MPALELEGLKIGRLTVLYKTSRTDTYRSNYWMCECDCGNLIEVRASSLKKTKSCGCLRREERPYLAVNIAAGLRAGKLTAIEKSHKDKNRSLVWKCLCDCGNYCYVRAAKLKSGEAKSCGCLGTQKKAYGEASRNTLIGKYRRGAAVRGLDFSLSNEECGALFERNCHYCDKASSRAFQGTRCFGEYIYNGIDRVINEKGYFINNAVPCCMQCNERKQALTYDEFLNHVDRIYNKLSKTKDIVYPLLSIDKITIDKACDFENAIKISPRMKALGVSNRNTLISRYKNDAKDRNKAFNLTKEEATFLFKSNCYYCQCPPYRVQNNKGSNGPFTYTGIDRVDNSGIYEKDNVVPCCKRCNSWKKALTYDQFRDWVVKVQENMNSKQLF